MAFYKNKFLNKITNREMEVLHLIAYEFTNKQIAKKLFISIDTVKTHRKNLLLKIHASNAAGLVRKGIELHLIKISKAS